MAAETLIPDLNEDCLIELFKNISSVEDLAKCSTASTRFKRIAQIAAKSSFKTLRIAGIFNLIRDNMQIFCNLLQDAVIELEIEIDSSTNFTLRQTQDAIIRPFISACKRLTHLVLINFPAPGWMINDPFHLSPSITTVSFVVQNDLRWVFEILQHFRDLINLNLFQKEYGTPLFADINRLYMWLQNNRIESIWLPNEFSDDLATIGQQVHTIRIHIDGNGGLMNLESLNNLTKIRIESIDRNAGSRSTARAIELLTEFGLLHGHNLKELHLCCNYNLCRLTDILNLFRRLIVLIIVNNATYSVALEDKLRWPATLTELKCVRFRIGKNTFNALVRLESLRKLDVYYCRLDTLDTNFALRRPVDYPTLKLLLAREDARQTGTNQQHEKYLETSSENVKLLNVYYTNFDIQRGLNIYIEFEGIKEPKYW